MFVTVHCNVVSYGAVQQWWQHCMHVGAYVLHPTSKRAQPLASGLVANQPYHEAQLCSGHAYLFSLSTIFTCTLFPTSACNCKLYVPTQPPCRCPVLDMYLYSPSWLSPLSLRVTYGSLARPLHVLFNFLMDSTCVTEHIMLPTYDAVVSSPSQVK